jgi:polyhydroxyalkanoate synthase
MKDTDKMAADRLPSLMLRMVTALRQQRPADPGLEGPGADLYLKTAAAAWGEALADPAKGIARQTAFWTGSLRAWSEALQGSNSAPEFWTGYLERQHQVSADTLRELTEELAALPERDRRRLGYFSDQLVQMLAPANYLGTNPDALARALETEGQSLLDGFENLVRDLENGKGAPLVGLVDTTAFAVGENIATTPGRVVLRTPMIELIQYAPETPQVHRRPIVIFPPWINKFYILDLRPENSLVRWLVGQGHTVFMVSWCNPGPEGAELGLEHYIEDGYLAAISEAARICGTEDVNVLGYCIGGTVLALALALMAKRGDDRVASATFLTTLTDFSDQGNFTPFLQDDFIDAIGREADRTGMLGAPVMARTFSMLRATDLVWKPARRSYLMGEAPPAFDLLYWNSDATNLPARMAMQYLRGLCQDNAFSEGRFELFGEQLDLRDVTVPLMSIAAEGDHIAGWTDCYRGFRRMGSTDKRFVLAEAGHVAGVVNPPGRRKYGHYSLDPVDLAATDWRNTADFEQDSWWPRWQAWLAGYSDGLVAAREPEEGLCAAPGDYVRVLAS